MSHACVYWIEEKLTSIVGITKVPAADRHKSAISRVEYTDGKCYPARIIAVSDDLDYLGEEEDRYMEKVNAETTAKGRTRNNRPSKRSTTIATEKQVSLSLGEKPQLNNKQSAAKRKASADNKVVKKNLKQAEKDLDKALLNARRSLSFSNNPDVSLQQDSESNPDERYNEETDSLLQPKNQRATDGIVSLAEDVVSTAALTNSISLRNCDDSLKSNMMVDESIPKQPSTSECGTHKKDIPGGQCDSCSVLKSHNNASVKQFLWDMASFYDVNVNSSKCTDYPKTKFLSPLVIPGSQKKCEVAQDTGLWISKASKNRLMITCDNDPYKLTRQLVEELYGREELQKADVTAMGNIAGGRGIGEPNLNAMYRFVKRNTPWDNPPPKPPSKKNPNKTPKAKPKLTFTMFVREINRKITSLRRYPFSTTADSDEDPSDDDSSVVLDSNFKTPTGSGRKNRKKNVSSPLVPSPTDIGKLGGTPQKSQSTMPTVKEFNSAPLHPITSPSSSTAVSCSPQKSTWVVQSQKSSVESSQASTTPFSSLPNKQHISPNYHNSFPSGHPLYPAPSYPSPQNTFNYGMQSYPYPHHFQPHPHQYQPHPQHFLPPQPSNQVLPYSHNTLTDSLSHQYGGNSSAFLPGGNMLGSDEKAEKSPSFNGETDCDKSESEIISEALDFLSDP